MVPRKLSADEMRSQRSESFMSRGKGAGTWSGSWAWPALGRLGRDAVERFLGRTDCPGLGGGGDSTAGRFQPVVNYRLVPGRLTSSSS